MLKKILLILFFSVWLTACGAEEPEQPAVPLPPEPTLVAGSSNPDPVEMPTPMPTIPPIPICIGTNNFVLADVVEVIDGDTIDVSINGKVERVRYLGVDAPEKDAIDPAPGLDAMKINQQLVEDKQVLLLRGETNRDEFGRLLRFVIVDEVFVNQYLLAVGAATSFNRPDQPYCADYFDETQYEAFQSRRGIWGAIAASYDVDVAEMCPEGCKSHVRDCDIKGNISRSGDFIFHIPGTEAYETTGITPSKGERWFCTIDEAIRNGWRPPRAE